MHSAIYSVFWLERSLQICAQGPGYIGPDRSPYEFAQLACSDSTDEPSSHQRRNNWFSLLVQGHNVNQFLFSIYLKDLLDQIWGPRKLVESFFMLSDKWAKPIPLLSAFSHRFGADRTSDRNQGNKVEKRRQNSGYWYLAVYQVTLSIQTGCCTRGLLFCTNGRGLNTNATEICNRTALIAYGIKSLHC